MVGVFGNSQKVSGDLWGIGLGGGQQLGEGGTGDKSPPLPDPRRVVGVCRSLCSLFRGVLEESRTFAFCRTS